MIILPYFGIWQQQQQQQQHLDSKIKNKPHG